MARTSALVSTQSCNTCDERSNDGTILGCAIKCIGDRLAATDAFISDLQQMNCVADHEALPEISQFVQPSKLTRAERRLWLLESIRANMLYYAAELESGAMRGCSLPSDGLLPAFTMCDEMRNDLLEEAEKIRATYHENWIANQLGTRPPESGSEIITKIVDGQHNAWCCAAQTAPYVGCRLKFLPANF